MKAEYKKWENAFKSTRLGKNALSLLKKELEECCPELYKRLKKEVLAACFHAIYYKKYGDRFSKIRNEKQHILQNTEKHLIGINALVNLLNKNHNFLQDIYLDGCDSTKEKDNRRTPTLNQLIDGLHALKDGLDIHHKHNPEGVFTYQQTYRMGNMAFYPWVKGNERLDKKYRYNTIIPETFLAFELDIFFRLWTKKEGQELLNNKGKFLIPRDGILKPKWGTPRYDIITPIVNAVFKDDIKQQALYERIKKYNTAHLVEWKLKDLNIGII